MAYGGDMEKLYQEGWEMKHCTRTPSTASSSSESYWWWEWRKTSLRRSYMNWTCVYFNLLYTSCTAWAITLATVICQNEPPGAWHRFAPLAPWGDHISLPFLLGSRGFIHISPIVRQYTVWIALSKENHTCYTYQCRLIFGTLKTNSTSITKFECSWDVRNNECLETPNVSLQPVWL